MKLRAFLIGLAFITVLPGASASEVAPDSSIPGPNLVGSGEYRLASSVDAEILADRETEVWARMWWPKGLRNANHPLVVFLHGNHGTCGSGTAPREDNDCSYSYSGTCPDGMVVTPNHEGYAYLAENLASWGYVVVSINANRGITCAGGVDGDGGLNLARGRLILKHLQLLRAWSSGTEPPTDLGLTAADLNGKLDFARVGLMGHSRGGEGARAAYTQYLDEGSEWPARIPGLKIKSVFEIGAVDGQTDRVLDAKGAAWVQLLPLCDGDVSSLEGRYPFERMSIDGSEPATASKALLHVWGANHNFYNTEWQTSDAYPDDCPGGQPLFSTDSAGAGSPKQRETALRTLPAFFRGTLGNENELGFQRNFNPLFELDPALLRITRVDRDYSVTPNKDVALRFEEFDAATGINTHGTPNQASNVTVAHVKAPSDSWRTELPLVGALQWARAGSDVFFQSNWTAEGAGRDVRSYATLDLRVSKSEAAGIEGPLDFSIALVDSSGAVSNAVAQSDFSETFDLPGHTLFSTLRIPLSFFGAIDQSQLRGVRLTFDKSPIGSVYVSQIRLAARAEQALFSSAEGPVTLAAVALNRALLERASALPTLAPSVRRIPLPRNSLAGLRRRGAMVEVSLRSESGFPVRDSLYVLQVGGKAFDVSRYQGHGLKTLVFSVPSADLNTVRNGAPLRILSRRHQATTVWDFGSFAR
jgi:hypothetical protein